MADIAELSKLIEPAAEAEGLKLVRVKMVGGTSDPTLQVMAEDPKTRQLTLDECARLSRRLSDILDEADPIEHAYRLEVSSPGIDRPLTRLSDFDDWKGHEARIVLTDKLDGRKVFSGNLVGTEGDTVLVEVPVQGATGLPFAAIQSAKLVMTDRLIAATAPLSAEGADEIFEIEPTEQTEQNEQIEED
ncbi:MAG TPA: ribosome maturation protein RimP [Allosphingosinicella sp.]|nr:ribosome maturation protein RimP [Allosphingosinicella sp.]